MRNFNKITLRRRNSLAVIFPAKYEQSVREKAMVTAFLKNIQALGFTFSRELLGAVIRLEESTLLSFYHDLIPELEKKVGADVRYKPMYPNFPVQVALASDAELYINAIIHYITLGTVLPEYAANDRLPLIDSTGLTEIKLCSHDLIKEIFVDLLSSKTSLSEQDKEDIAAIIKEDPEILKIAPDEIPLKENVAYISAIVLKDAPAVEVSASFLKKYFSTATDVLRLAVAMSGGDISLATPTKFKKFRRAERRALLSLLAGCGNILEDMFRYRMMWIRLAEILHPGEFTATKYREVKKAFETLRKDNKPLFFGGKVEGAITSGDIYLAADLLTKRPGEFARRLDKLLRDADSSAKTQICEAFKSVAETVSTPVLLQVYKHFCNRATADLPIRVFFPKGSTAKVITEANNLPRIDKETCLAVCAICKDAMVAQYATKPALGKVYVDPAMKDYLVPFSQRSASKAVKTIVRGSRCPISPDAKTVRGFIWWTNTNGGGWDSRVDLDLSAAVYDENWGYVGHVSYTQLRMHEVEAFHSGDITNGGSPKGDGVAEFIDFNIDAVAKRGRYVAFQVYSFTRQKFCNLPNARFGWMEREYPDSGEIFEPKTVQMKMDLTNEGQTSIPAIFDCVERKFIWCDMVGTISSCGPNCLETNFKGVTAVCYALTNIAKPNMGELAVLNARARGELVENREDADIIFSPDDTVTVEEGKVAPKVITPFDLDYWMGEML